MDFESLKKTYEADYCWEHPDFQVELFEDPEASNPKIYDLIEWFEEDVNNMFAMRIAWKVCLLIFCRAYCFFKYKNGNKYFLDFRMFESIISKLRIKINSKIRIFGRNRFEVSKQTCFESSNRVY